MALEIGRKCEVRTNLDSDGSAPPVFEFRRMEGTERLSTPFELRLDLVSQEADVDVEQVVAMPIVLKMPLEGDENRWFHGVVSRWEKLGRFGDEDRARWAYRAVVVPWLWTLKLTHDCRVFEGKTVKQIAEEIFAKYEFGDYEFPPDYEGEPMDHCVQYRESDFDFLSRLFEQWGLGYTFRHDEEKHQLVIFEASTSLNEVMGDDLSAHYEGKDGGGGAGSIQEFVDFQDLPPAYYEFLDFRFKDPDYEYKVWDWASRAMADVNYEYYEYPGGYVVEGDGKTEERGQAFAVLRREAREAVSRRVEGAGVSNGFAAGLHVLLDDHFRYPNGSRFLITEVQHVAQQSEGSERNATIYSNRFACLPDDVPFRPVGSTPRPCIAGTQTAIVVGPNPGADEEAEEIHTDKYGRVRIRFHWNRHVTSERQDLCWARVQQSLAGPRFGAQFLPRIGQEVVVSFLEGDPDRPVVIGCLYNGKNLPPYELPANKTQSGWKSRSSKEGTPDNYNEIRFEDKKDSEELVIHAERNMSTSVEADLSLSVGGKRSETIEKGQTTTVKEGGSEFTVDDGGAAHTVTGLTYFAVDGAMETYAGDGIRLDGTTGDSCPAVPQVELSSDHIKLEMGSSKIKADSSQIELVVGGSSIKIEDGTITVAAGTVVINGDGGSVTVTGDVEASGGTIKLNG